MRKLKLITNSLLGLVVAAIIIGCSNYSGVEADLSRVSSGGRVVAPGGDDNLRTKDQTSDSDSGSKKRR